MDLLEAGEMRRPSCSRAERQRDSWPRRVPACAAPRTTASERTRLPRRWGRERGKPPRPPHVGGTATAKAFGAVARQSKARFLAEPVEPLPGTDGPIGRQLVL